jgi:hypothetical protein
MLFGSQFSGSSIHFCMELVRSARLVATLITVSNVALLTVEIVLPKTGT